MNKEILLGLDIGTTNVKAAAFNRYGKLLVESSAAYPTYYPHPGCAEQDPHDWEVATTKALTALCAQLGSRAKQVAALGLSTHAPGLIPVDEAGRSMIDRVPIWQDERSLEHGQRLLDVIGSSWIGLGMPFASFGAKLRWYSDTQSSIAREADYAIGVKAYLAHWLTGTFATDPSSEPGRLPEWEDLCRACNWSVEKLAPVRAETDILGDLREELALEFGLGSPVPVVIGLNDGASATLGNGAAQAGEGVITLGTNGVLFLVTNQEVPSDIRLDDAIFCWPFVQERWIAGGQTKSGAASLQWFLNWTQSGSPRELDFSKLLEECADVPIGSRGVTFLPYLMGKGTPGDDPSATGSFLGLSLHTGRADLGRAVLEGVAFSLQDAMRALARHDAIAEKLMVTGGGAKSPLWRQTLADVLNQILYFTSGDSCLGAAMLAAVGIGLYDGIDTAIEAMRPASTAIRPKPDNVELYKGFYEVFQRRRDHLFELAGG